jgi:uncharacterized membrane protein YhaH (DUF805 family)
MNSVIKGRLNRATYWLLLGIVVAISALLVTYATKPPPIAEALMIFLGVPRLHDIGRSGWWMAVLFAFEVVAIAIAFVVLPIQGVVSAGGIIVFAMLIVMMILGCIPGDSGANAYGEVPAFGLSFGRAGT